MPRPVKIVLGIIVALLVLGGIATWLLVSNLDRLVERVVEDVGSETLGTAVALDGATVSLGEASAGLRGLTIANPAGFDSPYAFELGAIDASLDPGSVTTPEIVLPAIVVDRALITFEQKGVQNNLQALLEGLDSGGESSDAGSTESSSDVRLVIQEFRLSGAGVTVIQEQLGEPLTLTLPDLVLRDIGRVGAGVTAEQAARQIAEPILDRARRAASDRLRQELEGRARDELDRQKDKALDRLGDKLLGD